MSGIRRRPTTYPIPIQEGDVLVLKTPAGVGDVRWMVLAVWRTPSTTMQDRWQALYQEASLISIHTQVRSMVTVSAIVGGIMRGQLTHIPAASLSPLSLLSR